jgi:hypothetical protein
VCDKFVIVVGKVEVIDARFVASLNAPDNDVNPIDPNEETPTNLEA